jgi:hypothetical protein
MTGLRSLSKGGKTRGRHRSFWSAKRHGPQGRRRNQQDFEEGDHYEVRVRENMILLRRETIAEACAAAPIAATICARLGCGWFGSEAMWQSFQSEPPRIEAMQAEERPAFLDRQMSSLWGVDRSLLDAWRLGGWHVAIHMPCTLGPRAKYEKEHPDGSARSNPA